MKSLLFGAVFCMGCSVSALLGQTSVNPGTNAFASATLISGTWAQSLNATATNFTTEVSEPGHLMNGGVGAGRTAWWYWLATEPGFCTVSTRLLNRVDNAVGRTTLAVYTGGSLASLQRVGANEDWSTTTLAGALGYSQVTFYAVPGTVYRFAADGRAAGDVNANRFQLALELRFSPLAKTVRSGVWFLPGPGGGVADAGTVALTTTGTGAFSGRLVTMARTYAFKGVFGLDGTAVLAFERPKKNGLPQPPVSILVSLVGGGEMRLTQDGYEATAGLSEKAVFAAGQTVPTAGLYTAYQIPSGGGPGMATGYGTTSMSVAAKGQVRCMGTLPDGTAYACSGALMKTTTPGVDGISLFLPLYAKKGFFLMQGSLTDNGEADRMALFGVMSRPLPRSATDPYYPAGLVIGLQISGTKWTVPPAGSRALGYLNPTGAGRLRITNVLGELGGGGDWLENLTLSTANKFTFASSARKPSLVLNVKTGLVTGSITQVPLVARSIRAVLAKLTPLSEPYLAGHVRARTITLPLLIEIP